MAETRKTTLFLPDEDDTLPHYIIPKDILHDNIGPKLGPKELSALTQTCKGLNTLFKKPLTDIRVTRLLEYVAFGKQDEAEKMLKANPDLVLVLHKGKVTDYSDRTFKNISPLQYAAWALDTHMLKMILKYVRQDQRPEALQQLENLESKKTKHGAHYDFSPLITALQTYVDNYDAWNDQQCVDHWCKKVGGAQREVPVHIVNEYCRPDRSFGPVRSSFYYFPPPEFKESNLPRAIHFYNKTKSDSSWLSLPSNAGLGFDFALVRGPLASCVVSRVTDRLANGWNVGCDFRAITALCEVRTAELAKLKQQLLNPSLEIELSEAKNRYVIS